jgi:hypothetical protein
MLLRTTYDARVIIPNCNEVGKKEKRGEKFPLAVNKGQTEGDGDVFAFFSRGMHDAMKNGTSYTARLCNSARVHACVVSATGLDSTPFSNDDDYSDDDDDDDRNNEEISGIAGCVKTVRSCSKRIFVLDALDLT